MKRSCIYYEHGNRLAKFLARALKQQKTAHTISHIELQNDTLHASSPDIAEQFRLFYAQLYNLASSDPSLAPSAARETLISSFLAQHSAVKLTPEDSLLLESPLSETEVSTAIKQLKPEKSPGPDGLTPQYYKTFTNALLPHFVSAFDSLLGRPHPSTHMLEAHVAVIPKPGRDPSLCANY